MFESTRGFVSAFGAFFKSGAGFAISGNAGAPSNGTTFAGTFRALPGSLVVDTTNKILYINTGSKASPTWTKVGLQT